MHETKRQITRNYSQTARYITQLLSTGDIIEKDLDNRKCLIVLEVIMIVAMEQNLEHMFI